MFPSRSSCTRKLHRFDDLKIWNVYNVISDSEWSFFAATTPFPNISSMGHNSIISLIHQYDFLERRFFCVLHRTNCLLFMWKKLIYPEKPSLITSRRTLRKCDQQNLVPQEPHHVCDPIAHDNKVDLLWYKYERAGRILATSSSDELGRKAVLS